MHGWREGRQPHLCFNPKHYLGELLKRGVVIDTSQSPLEHYLEIGLTMGVSPTNLLHPDWLTKHQGLRLNNNTAPTLTDLHPWAAAALRLHASIDQASSILSTWIEAGIPDDEALAEASSDPDSRCGWAEPPTRSATLESLDAQPATWQQVGWLASLPLSHEGSEALPTERDVLHISWETPSKDTLSTWLRTLPGQAITIADPNANRSRMLRRFGVSSIPLVAPTTEQLNQWLPADPWLTRAEAWLGLPSPKSLEDQGVVCLGQGGAYWEQQTNLTLPYFPGFHDLVVNDHDRAKALASWLWHCHQAGITLVEFRTQTHPLDHLIWLPVAQINPYGLDQTGLLKELKIREADAEREVAMALSLTTAEPEFERIRTFGKPGRAKLAVLISLYNYEDQINIALDSIQKQTLNTIELIVVDDASTDQGLETVAKWLSAHEERFSYCALLRHKTNGGLAAARNTGFAHTQAEWCFVLDADNSLEVQALERCLQHTINCDDHLAVVHPLIRRMLPDATTDGLISPLSWQQESFLSGNHIDAMALVKRSAWQQIGGYTHIPGGWEDYDFWCKLIEAGYHGVICPHIVANYQIHHQSMVHQSSHRKTRTLSRLLQSRHPWLQLPLGGSTF